MGKNYFANENHFYAAFSHAVGIATSGESSQSESSGGLQEYMPMLHRLLSSVKLPDDVAEEAAQ